MKCVGASLASNRVEYDTVKIGVVEDHQTPGNSIKFGFRIQFWIMYLGLSLSFTFAISVRLT